MSFNFVIPETNIGGGTGTPTLQFYKRGFVLNGSSGGSPSWKDIILSGNTALTLVNSKANGLNYVKLFGGCEQTGTPTPDNPIDIVCNNGALKARHQSGLPLRYQLVEWLSSTNGITITDFKTKDTQTFKAKFIRNGSSAQYIYYSDTASSGTTNTTAYITGSANWRFDGTTKIVSITQDANILRKTIQNRNGVWVDGEQVATYTGVSSFTSTNDLAVLGSASAPPLRFYNLQVEEGGVNILDVVPVKDLIDDTYGVYDLIGQQFYTNPNATITAGNTVSDPIEIYTDGTTETVEVHGKNLFDKDDTTMLFNGFLQNSAVGAKTSLLAYEGGDKTILIKVEPNKMYTVTRATNISSIYDRIRVVSFTAEPSGGSRGIIIYNLSSNTRTATATFATLSDTKYIAINVRNSGAVGIDWQQYLDAFQLEEGSTATEYEPYYNGGSATAEMLLAVGDYKDEQNVTTGGVIRKVGIKVLDGTENWGVITNNRGYYFGLGIAEIPADTIVCLSNKFAYSIWQDNIIPLPDNYFGFNRSSATGLANGNVTFKPNLTVYDTVDKWKQYLAQQYAAETPVIVVYPLATPTTETVTAQHLTTQAGTNIVEITQASIDNLELEVSYKETI